MSEDEITRFEQKWKKIYTEGIEKVFKIADEQLSENINLKQYTQLYTIAYDICVSKSSLIQLKCYERLCETIKNYCIRTEKKIQLRHTENLLKDFITNWITFEETVLKWILKFFSYLTRQNFKIRKNLNLELDLKLLFKDHVYDKICVQLLENFFILMDNERRGQLIDFAVLKNFTKFLSSIETSYMEFLYNQDFENLIIENSLKFYKPVIQETLSKDYNFIKFFNNGLHILHSEEARLNNYLPIKTINKVITIYKDLIFFSNSSHLLRSGFIDLLKKGDMEMIRKTYEIFIQDQKSQDLMINIYKMFIKEHFMLLIESNEKICTSTDGPREVTYKTNFVDEFIFFYLENQKMLNEAFGTNNMFNVAYKEVLENVQCSNARFNNSYVLPFYIDKNLKKSLSNHSSESLIMIDSIVGIFPSLPDKDIFIDVHRNLLSNRLLNEDFISLDAEKYLITKLKLLCGIQFTACIEAMIMDYTSNKDLNERYKLWMKDQQRSSTASASKSFYVETSFSILTAEEWPKLNLIKINLPLELQISLDSFYRFYRENFPKRQLQWSFINSVVEIEGKLSSKSFLFVVNTYQAIILKCFNDCNGTQQSEIDSYSLNLKDISDKIGLCHNEVKNNIVPLLSIKLLFKNENDIITLNQKFNFNSRKVRIVNNPKDNEMIRKDKIEDDRSAAIEATIIRIMKSTQRIHHNELIKRVLEQLENFKIQIQTIKKKIDNLIEREFIKRDNENSNFYLYSSN